MQSDRPKTHRCLPGAVFIALSALLLSASALAEAVTLILYPEVRPPYNKVFEDISQGFVTHFSGNVEYLQVSGKTSPSAVSDKVAQVNPQVVLALGKNSYNLYQQSDVSLPLVLGATTQSQLMTAGISMIPDSIVIMQRLLELAPEVKRVYVVKRSDQFNDMVDRAQSYLDSLQIELSVTETASLQESASAYREILEQSEEGDAIWILPGSGVVDNSVLSMLLKRGWTKNLILFSSNPAHVKRGLLFAAYPDNFGLGGSLADLASQTLAQKAENKMRPLQNLHIAVNERTSRHLGIELTSKMKEEIDLLLPAR